MSYRDDLDYAGEEVFQDMADKLGGDFSKAETLLDAAKGDLKTFQTKVSSAVLEKRAMGLLGDDDGAEMTAEQRESAERFDGEYPTMDRQGRPTKYANKDREIAETEKPYRTMTESEQSDLHSARSKSEYPSMEGIKSEDERELTDEEKERKAFLANEYPHMKK